VTGKSENDYVLGTHDEEIARLGLQHRIWRPVASDCWRRAGITVGSRVIDIGAGPGYAAIDLAEIVGPTGEVLAVERSARFVEFARRACAAREISHVRFLELDLMEQSLDAAEYDAAWCRWVASFVSSPAALIKKIAGPLRVGGVAIFHEYAVYETWRLAPRRPAVESFTQAVMESWRESGGEPDVALTFPPLLDDAGLTVIGVQPHVLTVSPSSYVWQWPASFIETNLARLLQLGRVTEEWGNSVRREFQEAAADPTTLLITPMFLEIIARK